MKMKALENGPIIFETEGKSKIFQSGVEKKLESRTIAFCRCGQSKKSPFCDGSHIKTNFKAEAAEIEIE